MGVKVPVDVIYEIITELSDQNGIYYDFTSHQLTLARYLEFGGQFIKQTNRAPIRRCPPSKL